MLGWLIQCLIVIKSILTPWNRAQMKWIDLQKFFHRYLHRVDADAVMHRLFEACRIRIIIVLKKRSHILFKSNR